MVQEVVGSRPIFHPKAVNIVSGFSFWPTLCFNLAFLNSGLTLTEQPSPLVLHLSSWYPSQIDDKLGNFVEQQISAIQSFEAGVVLHVQAAPFNRLEWRHDQEPPVCRVYFKAYLPILARYFALKRGLAFLRGLGYRFKLAHLHVAYPNGIACFGLLNQLPLVISEHYSGYNAKRLPSLSRTQKFLAMKIFNRAAKISAVSQALQEDLKAFGVLPEMVVIPNVVNTECFHFEKIAEKGPTWRLLHVSSLQESTKNISGLIVACEMLLSKQIDFHLSIGGDGDLAELERKLKQSKLEPHQYTILGSMTYQEVAQQMQQAHLFVLASHIESQGIVLLESLACGRPVVAPAVGGIPEIVSKEAGVLAKSSSAADLAEALEEALHNYDRFKPQEKALWVKERFSPKAIGQAFSSLYASVRPW